MFLPDPPPPSAPAGLKLPVAILGGGIAGLSAAFELHRAGVPFRLFDCADRTGGVIRSEEHAEGWLVESGPNSFQLNSQRVRRLLEEAGLGKDILEAAPTAKNRYLVRGGKLLPVPTSLPSFLGTPLWSATTKLRLFTDLFRKPIERPKEISLSELVADHFGQELVDYALNPFVSGVYAGDVSQLSGQYAFPSVWKSEMTHGSLLRGMIAQAKARRKAGEPKGKIISFKHGLQSLPDALAKALPSGSVEVKARVTQLTPAKHGAPWLVRWENDTDQHIETFSAVLLTLPAHALAILSFGNGAQQPLARLAQVKYPPVTSLFLGYKRADVAHALDGFGALIPQAEKSKILGVLFSSTLFAGRAPEGHVALTVMVGGSLNPQLTSLEDSALLKEVTPELESLLGVRGAPVFLRRNSWKHAIPQYNVGYGEVLETLEAVEQTYDGLLIGGQVRDGIALPSCVEAGIKLADRVLKR